MCKDIVVGDVTIPAIKHVIGGVRTPGYALPGHRFTTDRAIAQEEAERLNEATTNYRKNHRGRR